jgi:hypothetical protein
LFCGCLYEQIKYFKILFELKIKNYTIYISSFYFQVYLFYEAEGGGEGSVDRKKIKRRRRKIQISNQNKQI